MNPFRRQELPPLENPVVLGLVFEYCNFNDLKVCRQVSRVWRESSLKTWRSSVRVRLFTFGYGPPNTVSKFLRFIQNKNSTYLESPFVTNYRMDYHDQKFWNLCGSTIRTLELSLSHFKSADGLRSVIFESCPNLEHLNLTYVKISEWSRNASEGPTEFVEPRFMANRNVKSLTLNDFGYDNGRYPLALMELFGHFPSLETLNLHGTYLNWDELIRALTLVRERDPQNLQLKHVKILNYGNGVPTPIFRILQDPGLCLVSLGLGLVNPEDANRVQEILRIHAASLKKLNLRLRNRNSTVNPTHCFPRLNLLNLQKLKLQCSQMSIRCLKFAPNLRKLVLKYYDDLHQMDLSEMADSNWSKIKELKIVRTCTSQDDRFAGDLRYLAKWLPDLESLRITDLTSQVFAVVCEQWPNLLSLRATGYVCDVGVTGLDSKDVKRINEDGETGTWRPITVPRANITAMKRLQSFHMTADTSLPQMGISSALCGILQLPQLRLLTIEHYVNMKIKPQNPKLWNAIRARLPGLQDGEYQPVVSPGEGLPNLN